MAALADLFLGLAALSTLYWLYALTLVAAFGRRPAAPGTWTPDVTVLKPLCGVDPGLVEGLRTLCEQRYPRFQVVFAVADADDPSVAVVHRLMEEYADRDLTLVVGQAVPGLNPKVVNLAHGYACAKHDVIVLADSDIQVGPDYLRTVVAPLADRQVGLVTCLYRGSPGPGVRNTLGAMFIDEWFFPSALVAAAIGRVRHAFGATIACRRAVLDAIGGFEPLARHLADDYALGRAVAGRGWRVVISPCVVETRVDVPSVRALFRQEVRWARTIRAVRPLGYACSVITYGLVWSALALLASGGATAAVLLAGVHAGVRLAAGRAARRALGAASASPWLLPVREACSLVVWAASFTGRTVDWRGRRFAAEAGGRLAVGEMPS